jgi:hypothetical protein
MYANLYGELCRPPFADFHVNSCDGTTRKFRCQRMEAEPRITRIVAD